jgi:hypothetical protein
MRRILAAQIVASAIGGIIILAGCSSGGWVGPSTLPSASQSHATHSLGLVDRSGLATGVLARTVAARPGPEQPSASLVGLFVAMLSTNDIKVLKNGTYTQLGDITNGLSAPDGLWVDQLGNLYSANVSGPNVTEYKKNQTTSSYTYSASLTDPITVTTDLHNNVFVGDYSGGGNGFVNEYKQHHNTVFATCAPGGGVEGVAVDTNGDVFVAYNVGGGANIVQYKHGLAGCHATLLGVTLHFAGGMVLAAHHILVVADQTVGSVDVIKPPYSSVSKTISVPNPFKVSLNKTNNRLFVSEPSHPDVEVLSYPSGTLLTTLGSSNGLTSTYGVTDEPNAVY